MENNSRPGMPPIEASGDPQPFNQPGVSPSGSAASFAAEFLATAAGQPPVPATVPALPLTPRPAPIPAPTDQPAPQPAAAVPSARPVAPAAPVQPFDRYGGPSAVADPLSNLEQLQQPPPLEDVQAPQDMGEKAGHAFAALKARMKEERKRAEEYLGKYNALVDSTKGFVDEKAKFADALNAKDNEIKQLQDDLGKIELSRSPAFREKYDAPLDATCLEIAAVLEQNGVPKDQAQQKAYGIMTTDPAALPDVIADLPSLAQGEISIRARTARKILADREAELAEWRKSQIGLEEVHARENDVRYAQHAAELADKAILDVRALTSTTGQIPAYAVTDKDFAAERDAREAAFKEWFVRAPEDQKVSAMLEGFMAVQTYKMLQQTMVENLQLKQALMSRGSFRNPPAMPTPSAPPPKPAEPKPSAPAAYGPATGGADAVGFAREFLEGMAAR